MIGAIMPRKFDPRREKMGLSAALQLLADADRRFAEAQETFEKARRRLKIGFNSAAVMIEVAERRAARASSRRRKPPEAGLAVPVEPPRGPAPKTGGAAAPLSFDTD
ncbi:MAG: hypothetical protein QNI87_08310 [Erythrobacter sp.]|uniref:hypothetical protein n=1 Tax=Erythrobacter sp. TaxID=1042 RepID=UPI002603D876|nr:hypothetical protein [Erythrobacter sp.]MDJ0978527.1 hypothetical protein [Erythrobacter sp.]